MSQARRQFLAPAIGLDPVAMVAGVVPVPVDARTDFILVEGTRLIFVSERVQEIVRRLRVASLRLVPADSVAVGMFR